MLNFRKRFSHFDENPIAIMLSRVKTYTFLDLLGLIVYFDKYTPSGWKAGGHEPPLFPLPCHILAFLSFGSYGPPLLTLQGKTTFKMVY